MADPLSLAINGMDDVNGELDMLLQAGGSSTWTIGSDVRYAIYVEMGTSKMAAQPYLRPAIAEVMANQADEIADTADDVDDLVEQIAEAVVAEAKNRVPVRTGRLKSSIHAKKTD